MHRYIVPTFLKVIWRKERVVVVFRAGCERTLKLTHIELVTSCIFLCHIRCIVMTVSYVCWCVVLYKVLHYMFEIISPHQLAIYVNFNVCNRVLKTDLNTITSALDPTLKTNGIPHNENDSGDSDVDYVCRYMHLYWLYSNHVVIHQLKCADEFSLL